MTVREVKTFGEQRQRSVVFRGVAYAVDFTLRAEVTVAVDDDLLPAVLAALRRLPGLAGSVAYVTEIERAIAIDEPERPSLPRLGASPKARAVGLRSA